MRAPGASAGLGEQARIVVRLIERLGLERPLLVGHSLGGTVALAVAIEHPQAICGLALLAPYTHYSGEVAPAFAPLHIAQPWKRWLISQTIGHSRCALKTAPQVLDFIFGPQAVPADYAISGRRLFRAAGQAISTRRRATSWRSTATCRASSNATAKSTCRSASCSARPTACCPMSEHGLAMQGKIAGLELELLDGIGHMPQFVAADRVVAFIRRMAGRAFG